MSTTSVLPILIVGAGPSGLAAALTLAQNGVPVRIIDTLASFHTSSRGSGLQPRTIEIFRFLGILEDVRNQQSPIVPMRLYKLPGGTEVLRTWDLFDKIDISPSRPEGILIISQYRTEEIFREHLSKYGVHVELQTQPTTMEQDAEGVCVTLKKIDQDGKESSETVRVGYVIGADGARGFTRKAIGATFEGETRWDDGQAWADAVVEGVTQDYWRTWSEPGKFTISMRPKRGTGEFHIGIIGQNFDPVGLDEEKFVALFQEKTGRTDIVFKKVTSMTYWKPKMRMVNKLAEGRVFIVGDAAHIHSSTGGQGLNTSIQDAFNVSWKLAVAQKGLASPDLLASYDSERLPVVTHMLIATTNLYTHLVSKKAEDVQIAAAPPAAGQGDQQNKSGFLQWRNKSLHQLEINYRWSAAVFDARGTLGLDADDMKARAYEGYPGGDVRAGDRAPDAPALLDANGTETALFDLFTPYTHTLLLFAPEAGGDDNEAEVEAVVTAARASPQGTIRTVVLGRHTVPKEFAGASSYQDKDGHAKEAYHVDGKALTIVVVRPDAYVGAFVYDVAGLQKYFSRVFNKL